MGNLEVASPYPIPELLRMMLRPHLLCHADITAETPIPWPQKLCFRASILPLCTQFTASYSSFGSFPCLGTQGIFASLFLIAIVPCGLCFLYWPLGFLWYLFSPFECSFFFFFFLNFLLNFFLFWDVEFKGRRNVNEINISLGTSKLPVFWALKLNMAYLVVRPTWKCYLQ